MSFIDTFVIFNVINHQVLGRLNKTKFERNRMRFVVSAKNSDLVNIL